jgi:hypothetical protein
MFCRESPGGAYGAVFTLLVGWAEGRKQFTVLAAIERDHHDQLGIFTLC